MAIIIDRQRKLNTVGTIRLGDVKGEKSPGRPLWKFRLSSIDKALIEQAAEVYGGEVRFVDHLKEWDVVTERTQIKAYISLLPRDPMEPDGDLQSLVQHFYRRDGRRWTHRCDGVTCDVWADPPAISKRKTKVLVQRPCQCDPENRACKMSTLLIVGLTEVAVSGVWKLSTGSTTFDSEIQGFVNSMRAMGLTDMPVVLTYDKITKAAAPGETAESFPVIRVDVDHQPVSLPDLFNKIRQRALTSSAPALEAPPTAPQLPAETAVRPGQSVERSEEPGETVAEFTPEPEAPQPSVREKMLAKVAQMGGTEKAYDDLVEVLGDVEAKTVVAEAFKQGLAWDGMMAAKGWA